MNSLCEMKPGVERTRLLRRDEADQRSDSYGSISTTEKNVNDIQEKGADALSSNSTPLPFKQLLVIFVMRLAEPIAYSQVLPYINEMMEDIGIVNDPRRAGYYSGVLESTFAIAELLTVMKWGSLSDQVGRKPVLLAGFTGAMFAALIFGFSKSFFWALTARCMAGGLSGNVAILLSAVGDMTDESNQARAYAIFGVANNIAQMAGPFIGGTFAEPVKTFPDSFGTIGLFQTFPFLLPCLVSALITLVATCSCALFFSETRRWDSSKTTPEPIPRGVRKQSTWSIATAPVMLSILRPFFLLSILNTSLIVVFSLFSYTPIPFGGLSRNPGEIGLAVASAGLIGAIIQVIILPELQLRYGTLLLYRFFMALWPIIYVLFPLLNAIARYTIREIEGQAFYFSYPESLPVWTGVAILLSLNRLASMSYSLNLILTKNAAPSPEMLGKVFALSHFVNCIARAVAPSFVSTLFALSKEQNMLGGNFVWVVMCAVAFLGAWATFEAKDGSIDRDA